MGFKLFDSFITTCISTIHKSNQFSSNTQIAFMLQNKRKFCSKNDSDDPLKNINIKELLNSSSPLKSLDKDDFWGTSPYPPGTVFKEVEEERYTETASASRSIILFPGQGNQFVGMAKNLLKYPVAVDMFKAASDLLGYNLLKICLEGPEEQLNETKYCQPATFVCSLALLEKIKEERPWAIGSCKTVCGYSLGELTALVFAGVFSFETGLKLVKLRAEAMEECCKKVPGGMLTVLIGPRSKLSVAISDAKNHCLSLGIKDPCCAVASYLFPNCKVVAGNKEALDFLIENKKTYGILRQSLLPVSGAFHTDLMRDAAQPFSEKLKNLDLNKPKVRVFSNVTGKPYSNRGAIIKLLPKQIFRSVRWHQTMQNLVQGKKNMSETFFYECGPGSSLISTLKKVDAQASRYSFSIKL